MKPEATPKPTRHLTSRFASFARRACLPLLGLALFAGRTQTATAQSFTIVSNWFVTNAVASTHIATGDVNRGLAYSAVSNQVFVANKGTPAIDVFNATNGVLIGSASLTGVSGGTFPLNKLVVASDGTLYTMNLQQTTSSGMKIYQWTNWATAPTVSYSGDPLGGTLVRRMGDNLAIQGSGTSTVLLAPTTVGSGTQATNNVILFSTLDGTNFTPTILTITNLPPGGSPNGPEMAVAFYTNGTFLYKQTGTNLYVVQYPANFASLTSPVQVGIIASNSFSATGNLGQTVIAYNSAASLLATLGPIPNAAPGTTPATLSFANPLTNITTSVGSTTFPHANANGNFAGAVVLGGTNLLFTLDCNNGVRGFSLVFPTAPIITAQPAGVTGAFNPQTLTVTAGGAPTLVYNWFSNTSNTNTGGTLLQTSTNSSFIVGAAVTNFYYVVVTNSLGAATSSVAQVSLIPSTTNSVVTSLFSIGAGNTNFPFVANDDNTRGIGYDTNTQRLVVANKTSGANVFLVDGTTGTNLGKLNTNGMPQGGTFPIDQVGVADDGVVYAGNLAISATFTLTSWSSPTTNATAFSAGSLAASSDRWGDNMAVRGAGVNTQILLSSRTTNIALFTTGDGVNFTALVIPIPGVPNSFAGSGVCFGAGNTLWGKNFLGDLFEVAFDPTGATPATVVQDYSSVANAQIPLHMVGVAVDPVHNILGGVDLSDQNPDLQLFQLTGSANPPVLFDQAFFPVFNPGANGNSLGAVVMKFPRAYALDVDIGIVGVTYGVPASTAPAIVSQPAGETVFASTVPITLSVGVSGTLPLVYQWQKNSVSNALTATNISGANAATLSVNVASTNATGWYDVVVTNFGGSVTSAPALLTVVLPVTNVAVTNLWRNAPGGTNAYLDSGSFAVRGLAYDTNSGTLLLANHLTSTITVLNAADGSLNSNITINTAGLPGGTFTLDQIAVADDGILYGGNLALETNDTFSLTSWNNVANSGTTSESAAYLGDPGSGSGDRWGDTIAIRGAGINTQILLGSYGQGNGPGTNVALLTTVDGVNFTALSIPVANVPGGFAGLGIAFGAGNTFWAKGTHFFDLRQVSFDPTGSSPAVVLQDYSSPTQTPTNLTGLGVDAVNNILIGTCFDDTPNDLQFYLLTGTTNPPVLFDQAFYGSQNGNSQQNAVGVIKFPYAFGLNVNNGLVAVKYGVPSVVIPFSLTAAKTGTNIVISWPTSSGRNYQLQSSTSVLKTSNWTNAASLIPGTGSTVSVTNASPTGPALFYRVFTQ